jgi:methylated-DNA-[protein]-cysteine S-methyltransferase
MYKQNRTWQILQWIFTMKKQKNIRIGRISLQLDIKTGKILKIGLHPRTSPEPANDAPATIAKAAKTLNGGYQGKKLNITPNDLELEIMKPFQKNILLCLYENVPPGKVITYSALAALAGHPGAARAVGTVMSHNPFPMILPCHRVLPATGKIGHFGSGPAIKKEILKSEGITFDSKDKINACHFLN